MSQSSNTGVELFTPSLPKGGGAMTGMGGSVTEPGTDGMVRFNVPIPVTSGRYLTPDLSLSYSSGNGNGSFGMGWNMGLMGINRRTNRGIPTYNSEDEFMGPDGEVLIPEKNAHGQIMTRQTDTAQGLTLSETFTVTRYFPRIEGSFNLIEYWEAGEDSLVAPFWLIHSADGTLHCLGKTAQARIASANAPDQIAEWLLEESVSPFGEHIYYQYKAEDGEGINREQTNHPYGAKHYLKSIHYGNKTPDDSLYLWNGNVPMDDQWLYSVILDYGENDPSVDEPPLYNPHGKWTVRADPFSRFGYGFEVRNCRLCRQILMFHHFTELAEEPTLVWQMQLEYDECPALSMLSAVEQVAYEGDGTKLSMPPLELDYTPFKLNQTADWQPFLPLPEFEYHINYQMVDLFGEGIPGILYQDKNQWYYRSPVRGNKPDGIAYENWKSLPKMPANSQNGMLIDINGDGYLDWLIVQSGVAGSYRLNKDQTWSEFVALKALPTEFFHPKAQFSNVTGSSLTDLVMIGPKSVRFYAGEDGGYKKACEVWQNVGVTLPIEGFNQEELVAFSDMLGSGQPHLVHIRHDGVTCWPNIGNGVFGTPLKLPGFNRAKSDFNPERVYLVDIDGSGTSDLIYAAHDCLIIYQNLSGNGFSSPLRMPLPDGVYFDHLCRLIAADISGQGVANLILSVPYKEPRSWCLSLFEIKPYLLKNTNNNMGGSSTFVYRSSAQYWLDEKKADPSAICALPFPINVLSCMQTLDEMSGNSNVQKYTYRKGFYDKYEKEFNGFGYIEIRDESFDSQQVTLSQTPPTLSRTWYHTGHKADEDHARHQYWQGDVKAFLLRPTYLTRFDLEMKKDVPLDFISEQQAYWLYRSLKGMPLRTEMLAGDCIDSTPYTVENFRYQVRLVSHHDSECITLPLSLEQLTYQYEQIASDPQCTQQIQQFYDKYGFATQSVTIQYPRRAKPNESPYPDTLPDTSWNSSYDRQQAILRITRQREKVYHLSQSESWCLGIPHQTRMDIFSYSAERVPSSGISIEFLTNEGTLESPVLEKAYGGQTEVIYMGETRPDSRALVYYTRSAVLDESCLRAYEGILSNEQLTSLLATSGYKESKRLLSDDGDVAIFVAEQGFTRYAGKEEFYRPIGQQVSCLTGEQVLSWDENYCVVTSVHDVLGNQTQMTYDYRFLQAIQIIDANKNVNQVALDAFGQGVYSRIWGTENGKETGFNLETEFLPPKTIDQGLALTPYLPVATCFVYDMHSWMGSISLQQLSEIVLDGASQWSFLIDNRFITPDGRIRARGRCERSLQLIPSAISHLLRNAKRLPPHTLSLSVDRYQNDPAQQIQANLVFSDGFGRTIQKAIRAEIGTHYQLSKKEDRITNATDKWAVLERVNYDVKGRILQTFQPFYHNDWEYVKDGAINSSMYPTTYDYDHLGRQTRTVNAKGYEKRVAFYPWFTVNEDENDTMGGADRNLDLE